MKTSRIVVTILAIVYILVGLFFWWTGGGWNAPNVYTNLFTFFYVVFCWPIMMGLFILSRFLAY